MPKKSRKAAKPKAVAVGAIPKLTLNLPIDAKKAKAIQACMAKGTLSITLNKVDLQRGTVGAAWLYD